MRRFLILVCFLVPLSLNAQIIVGYYYGDSVSYPASRIEFDCLTHVAHAFLIPDSLGGFSYNSFFLYPGLVERTHDTGRKIVVSIGGWGGSQGFRPMAADPLKRNRFITSLVNFIKVNHYDGADIDWEYPQVDEKKNFIAFISEIREAFDSAGIEILSAALPAIDWHNVFDADLINSKLTWAGIMTYDFYGPWEKTTGHNTALYSAGQILSVDSSIQHYLKKGVRNDRLCMGLEFAGYKFRSDGIFRPHKGAGSVSYIQAMKLAGEGWDYMWDERAKVPFLFCSDSLQFITIDDTLSVRHKTQYMLDQKIAGTIIWKLGLDYRTDHNELQRIVGEDFLCAVPEQVRLTNPSDNEIIYNSETLLKWSPVHGPVKYLLEVSENQSFAEPQKIYLDSTQSIFNGTRFNKYFWRVRAENNFQNGEWSETVSFYQATSLSEYKRDFISVIEDRLNYILHNRTYVSMSRFNMYGEELETIIYLEHEPGMFTTRFKDIAPNDYYRFVVNEKTVGIRKGSRDL